MPAMTGVLSGSHVQYEAALKAMINGGWVTVGYRPYGTQAQVFLWYRDAINLGILKMNGINAQLAPNADPIPLLD